MIGVDVNIDVRYAVKDDPQQTILATDFLARHHCFILKTVLLEFSPLNDPTPGKWVIRFSPS
jgi:predicted nucleic-acid-binding protein